MRPIQQMQIAFKDFLFEALKKPNSKLITIIQTILSQEKLDSAEIKKAILELKTIQTNIKNEKEESEQLVSTLLANCAFCGIGFDAEEKKLAFDFCKTASEQSYPLAQYVMARCLANANGCEEDMNAAIIHFQLAANAGIVGAQIELQSINEERRTNTVQNQLFVICKWVDRLSAEIESMNAKSLKNKELDSQNIDPQTKAEYDKLAIKLNKYQTEEKKIREYIEVRMKNLTKEHILLDLLISQHKEEENLIGVIKSEIKLSNKLENHNFQLVKMKLASRQKESEEMIEIIYNIQQRQVKENIEIDELCLKLKQMEQKSKECSLLLELFSVQKSKKEILNLQQLKIKQSQLVRTTEARNTKDTMKAVPDKNYI